MGAVYRARQKSLKREVAIKVLPPVLGGDDHQFAARFKAEAEVMAKLNHPGVVAVYDAGETPGGLLYIVMEFVEGTDVAQMIKSTGKLAPDYAYSIAASVCDALAYAHENGLVHRDIKPANIMVDTQGRVKVADFGLAKMTHDDSGFTQTNMVLGTPDFLAPEALSAGVPLDGRADLYAVGVMLYQMLTGSLPRGAFKPASAVVPGVNARLDPIVQKAMQGDPEERFSSAQELRQSLDTLSVPADPPASSASPHSDPPPRKSKLGSFVGITAVTGIAAGAFFLLKGNHVGDGDDAADVIAPLVAATTSAPFVNSLGMKFVPVPDTRVLFCIHEVRYRDYAEFAAAEQGVNEEWRDQSADGYLPPGNLEQHPVINVSWEDAKQFCAWLSRKEGRTYRLPTDEEWSIAVGLGESEKHGEGITPAMLHEQENTQYPWGQGFPPRSRDRGGNYSDESRKAKAYNGNSMYLNGYEDGFPTTAPVMSFLANPTGLYDIGGNVWEWCEDWYDETQQGRVARGGSFGYGHHRWLLSSFREKWKPDYRNPNFGFRCVVEVPEAGRQ